MTDDASALPPPLPPTLPEPREPSASAPSQPERPRVWSALVVGAITIPVALIVSGIVQAFALVALGAFRKGVKPQHIMAVLERIIDQPWGPAALILPGQLTMLAAVLGAALLSPRKLAPRLGFVRSALPLWSLPLLVGGALFAGQIGGIVVQWLFPDPGPNLRLLLHMMQKPQGWGVVGLVLMICVLPGLVEESLFRGYIQRRLLERWHPAWAIAASSVFFTAAHFDPVHVLAVVPLAVWLGVVAWRCGSVWPGMLCHAVQNAFAVWSARHGDALEMTIEPRDLVLLAITAVLAVAALMVMRQHPARSGSTSQQPVR